MKMILTFLILLSSASLLWSQQGTNEQGRYENRIFVDSVQSVTLHRFGQPLSLPIISLNSQDPLVLEFDLLGEYAEPYRYTIELCNQDWTPTDLTYFNYMEGYDSSPLDNYEFSYTSLQPYTHYYLRIPNRNCKPTKAGNYILKVFREGEPGDVILTQKFFVTRQKVSILPNVRQSSTLNQRKTYQEVDFKVQHKGIPLSNPIQSISATIVQNSNMDGAHQGLKPVFIQENVLSFDLNTGNSFQGMREFRWFDTRSLIRYGQRIKMVETYMGKIHVFVTEDEVRAYKQYIYLDDINGNFLINTLDENEGALQAHYTEVHFTLPMTQPLNQGDLYIMGDLTNWQAGEENKLKYNPTRKAYEGTLYLKQGLYNYLYGYKKNPEAPVDYDFAEGNFFESENDYTIFIYHRPFGERYDELIGVKTFNTIRGN